MKSKHIRYVIAAKFANYTSNLENSELMHSEHLNYLSWEK